MKASFDQHGAHSPSPPTGSRQAAQSCGKATSTASPKAERKAPASRARRRGGSSVATSSCMAGTLSLLRQGLNGLSFHNGHEHAPTPDHLRPRFAARPPAAGGGVGSRDLSG